MDSTTLESKTWKGNRTDWKDHDQPSSTGAKIQPPEWGWKAVPTAGSPGCARESRLALVDTPHKQEEEVALPRATPGCTSRLHESPGAATGGWAEPPSQSSHSWSSLDKSSFPVQGGNRSGGGAPPTASYETLAIERTSSATNDSDTRVTKTPSNMVQESLGLHWTWEAVRLPQGQQRTWHWIIYWQHSRNWRASHKIPRGRSRLIWCGDTSHTREMSETLET